MKERIHIQQLTFWAEIRSGVMSLCPFSGTARFLKSGECKTSGGEHNDGVSYAAWLRWHEPLNRYHAPVGGGAS
jgi:hypothetical protein